MNFETNRLNTFTNWPACAVINPVRIAKAGFFYTGQGTEVQCFSCRGKLAEWNCGDQVMARHRLMYPNCQFAKNPRLSGNVPITPFEDSPEDFDDPLEDSPPRSSSNDQNNEESSQDYGRTEQDDMYKTDILRLLSFTNWTDTSVSQEALVNAGFYHVGEGRLRCAWCGGELAPFRNFGSLGPPLEVHRMYFPRCAHARSLETAQRNNHGMVPTRSWVDADVPDNTDNNQPQSSGAAQNERVVAAGSSWRSLGVVGGGARHVAYASLASRLQTFNHWPANRAQVPKALAEAGFYYTGVDDQWEAGDAPWTEHAHWFPHCGYVLLVKGQDFVESCRSMAVQRTLSADSGLSTRRRNPGSNFSVTDSQVDACMESGTALAALGAGLDAARVRRALVRRLRTTGLPFSSSEALIDAVLDEQLNEESWSVAPQSQRLARDILAETLSDFVPASGTRLMAPPRPVDESESRSESDSSASSTPAVRNLAPPRRRDITPSRGSLIQTRGDRTHARSYSSSKDRKNSGDKKRAPSPAPQKKELTLEEENRQLKEARLCKVCMDSEVSVVFLPCGHLVSCAGCGAALSACPLCRGAVRALVRAYLA
ncbi:Apoptosis 2 inhibitor [Papilio xuthus]|uniref:Apoptosis 2 inhibitor n=1 Tax=Papilio xuthus TaxID=66420 RepID=A0A194PMR4_PAPXU|nr:Apoptosis 2 inhibitor [Papilio xuthus]